MKIHTVFLFVCVCECVRASAVLSVCVFPRSVIGGMKPSTSPSVGGGGYVVGCEHFLAIYPEELVSHAIPFSCCHMVSYYVVAVRGQVAASACEVYEQRI